APPAAAKNRGRRGRAPPAPTTSLATGGGVGSLLMRSQPTNVNIANWFQSSVDFFSALTILCFTSGADCVDTARFGRLRAWRAGGCWRGTLGIADEFAWKALAWKGSSSATFSVPQVEAEELNSSEQSAGMSKRQHEVAGGWIVRLGLGGHVHRGPVGNDGIEAPDDESRTGADVAQVVDGIKRLQGRLEVGVAEAPCLRLTAQTPGDRAGPEQD